MNRNNTEHPREYRLARSSGPLESCPLCGGDIQSTRLSHFKHLRLSPDGQDVVDDGRSSDVDGESTIYCENDHTQAEMIEHERLRTIITGTWEGRMEEAMELLEDARKTNEKDAS
jgi:hypothetical protein|tara:strand:+ start:110 stop:454 length:345 start_codon:yes stop_codon:yes gene_type:complete